MKKILKLFLFLSVISFEIIAQNMSNFQNDCKKNSDSDKDTEFHNTNGEYEKKHANHILYYIQIYARNYNVSKNEIRDSINIDYNNVIKKTYHKKNIYLINKAYEKYELANKDKEELKKSETIKKKDFFIIFVRNGCRVDFSWGKTFVANVDNNNLNNDNSKISDISSSQNNSNEYYVNTDNVYDISEKGTIFYYIQIHSIPSKSKKQDIANIYSDFENVIEKTYQGNYIYMINKKYKDYDEITKDKNELNFKLKKNFFIIFVENGVRIDYMWGNSFVANVDKNNLSNDNLTSINSGKKDFNKNNDSLLQNNSNDYYKNTDKVCDAADMGNIFYYIQIAKSKNKLKKQDIAKIYSDYNNVIEKTYNGNYIYLIDKKYSNFDYAWGDSFVANLDVNNFENKTNSLNNQNNNLLANKKANNLNGGDLSNGNLNGGNLSGNLNGGNLNGGNLGVGNMNNLNTPNLNLPLGQNIVPAIPGALVPTTTNLNNPAQTFSNNLNNIPNNDQTNGSNNNFEDEYINGKNNGDNSKYFYVQFYNTSEILDKSKISEILNGLDFNFDIILVKRDDNFNYLIGGPYLINEAREIQENLANQRILSVIINENKYKNYKLQKIIIQ